MFLKHEIFKEAVALATAQALQSVADGLKTEHAPNNLSDSLADKISTQSIAKLLSQPPQFHLGQAALPCFPFAKMFRMAPPALASLLKEKIDLSLQAETAQNPKSSLIDRIEVAGGFLNFFAHFENLAAQLLPAILDQSLFQNDYSGRPIPERIVVEYSQPNTHKALHVGHLRCLVLGDAVSRILAGVGHDVVKVTYPGDMGAHIAKTLWYLKNHYVGASGASGTEAIPSDPSLRGDWLGDLYAEAHAFAEAAGEDPVQLEKNKAAVGAILAELQSGSGPYYDLWTETREWSFAEMRKIYNWMNVSFDEWYTESECDGPSRELVLQKAAEGLFVKDEGAIGIDLSEYKLGFALLLKSDGNGLYLTKDLELIKRKFSDPRVTRSVVVVDARQKLHFRQLFKIAELMGYPQAALSVHLDYETVNTADGKKAFSSRTKSGMKLGELRSLMEAKVKTDYLARYANEWSQEEINHTAEIVTVGALKYGMLKVDNNTQVNFDINEWLRLDGDTGPYLQYVHARCLNILAKQMNNTDQNQNSIINLNTQYKLEKPIEHELIMHLVKYFDALKQAADLMRPAFVCSYLLELAKLFNRFYEQCSIKESIGETRATRLELVRATARVMQRGLDLLGIEAPEKM